MKLYKNTMVFRKIFIIPFLMVSINSIMAQPAELSDLEPYGLALIVKDIDISQSWYSDVLGFKVENRIDQEARGFKLSNLERNNAVLELIELDSSIDPDDILNEHAPGKRLIGFFKFGFRVKDFDGWISHFREFKVRFSGDIVTDPSSTKRMVIILDPDGNRIQIFEE